MSIDATAHDRLDAAQVLTRARLLASDHERAQLDRLATRLTDQRLRVLVAGEAKRGKSTLTNAVLQRELLPTGVTPLTSVATTVTAAGPEESEHATVTFHDGHTAPIGLAELPRFVTEAGNPENSLGVADVTVYVHDTLLDDYAVDLVDTPGTGSVYEHNTADAHEALRTLDAAVLVLTADPPVSRAERELLEQISATSVRTFVVLNKSDRLDPEEIRAAVAFTERVCSEAVGTAVGVQACCARDGRADAGFSRFLDALVTYLGTRGASDVRRALTGHLRRILVGMLDGARIRERSLQLARTGSRQSTRDLRARLQAISAQREALQDVATGSIHRLRRELDASAQDAGPRLARSCREQLTVAFQERLDSLSVAMVEQAARSTMAAIITAAVDDWRTGATTRLEDGLRDLVEQTRLAVSAQLELARAAVQQALDLSLTLDSAASALRVDPGFRYDYTPPLGWEAPFHSSLTHLRSEAHRRARIRSDVLAQVSGMTDRQLGRARADLQVRLVEAGRHLGQALEDEVQDTIGRLVTVMDEAIQDTRSSDEHGELAVALSSRARSIEQLLDRVA